MHVHGQSLLSKEYKIHHEMQLERLFVIDPNAGIKSSHSDVRVNGSELPLLLLFLTSLVHTLQMLI